MELEVRPSLTMNSDWRIGITLVQTCSLLNNHWKSVSMNFSLPIFIQSLDQKIQSSFMRIYKTFNKSQNLMLFDIFILTFKHAFRVFKQYYPEVN